MSKQPPNIDTVIIRTNNLHELAAFYRKGFNLPEPMEHGGNHLGFQLPSVYLGFDLVEEPPQEYPGAVSLWFRVDDLDAVFNHFLGQGAKVKYPPTEKPWGDTLAAIFDPDGNVIGLAQRKVEGESGG